MEEIRDWSIIMGRGATKREGGRACAALPLRKGGVAEKVLSILKGEHIKFWGGLYAIALTFSHIEGMGAQKVSTVLNRGGGPQ